MKRQGIGLIRVSTGAQAAEDRASIPAQREIIRQIASRHQIDVVQMFELSDISGAMVLFSREYHAFLKCLENPAISAVITREFSRLMRPERFDDFAILQHFVDNGITLYFPNDVLDLSSRQARFMAGIRAGVSGLERGDIAERIASAKEVLRRKGYHPSGEHTLARGIGHTKEKGWYYDDKELASVRLLFRLFLDGCQVYETLATLTGISRASVPVILRNPIYTGWMVYSKRKDASSAGLVPPTHRRKGYRKHIARDEGDVIRVRVPLEPVITEEEHARILEIVENKRRHFSSVRADSIPRFTYRSFLYCGACSSPLYTWAAQGGKDFYHCKANMPRYRKQGRPGCSNRNMSRHLLEPKLDAALIGHLTDAKFLTGIIESHLAQIETQPVISTDDLLQSRFEALQAKRARTIQAFIDGNLTRLQKNELLRDIDDEINAVSILPGGPPRRRPIVDRKAIAGIVQVFRDWTLLGMEQKRELMTRLLPEIFVHRYLVSGVSLRVGYNSANPSTTIHEVITSATSLPKPASETIYVPFGEEIHARR